ncbi:MAG: DUF4249 family protein [Cyclobacteriaceae bacterium]|nr:DUF4249 family protein [Cyclobacteriaceae bacterium]
MKKSIYIVFVLLGFACEFTIDPTLENAEKIIVVDAWVNTKMERQEIKVTRSQPYFENTFPSKISGGVVTVTDLDDGTIYNFQEGTDSYYWDPVGTPFGTVGHNYRLEVVVDGETFESYSTLGRVPPIDTMMFHYNPKDAFVPQEYYIAEFVATDPVGFGDAYWIKSWKNGMFLNKPTEINISVDGGFSEGQAIDGQIFNLSLRRDIINPYDQNPNKETEILPPFIVGDSIYLEIHSITIPTYEFLWNVYFQTARTGGFAELFATPLANVPTNITNINTNSTTNVAGFFNVSSVSSAGLKLTQQIADEAKLNSGN